MKTASCHCKYYSNYWNFISFATFKSPCIPIECIKFPSLENILCFSAYLGESRIFPLSVLFQLLKFYFFCDFRTALYTFFITWKSIDLFRWLQQQVAGICEAQKPLLFLSRFIVRILRRPFFSSPRSYKERNGGGGSGEVVWKYLREHVSILFTFTLINTNEWNVSA